MRNLLTAFRRIKAIIEMIKALDTAVAESKGFMDMIEKIIEILTAEPAVK